MQQTPNTPIPGWHDWPWLQAIRSQLQTQSDSPHNGFLIGPAGIGKRPFAMGWMQWALCETPQQGRACRSCHGCHMWEAGTHPDAHLLMPEGAHGTIKMEAIRSLQDRLAIKPRRQHYVLITHGAALNLAAANALLKTLEEPVAPTSVLIVAEYRHAIPITLASRCQVIRAKVPSWSLSLAWLRQQGLSEEEAAKRLRQTFGRPWAALNKTSDGIDEQCVLDDLLQLTSQATLWPSLSAKWSEQDPFELLNCLISMTMALIKSQLNIKHHAWTIDWSAYHHLSQTKPLSAWFAYLDILYATSRLLNTGKTLNTAMIVDSLIVQWLRQPTRKA